MREIFDRELFKNLDSPGIDAPVQPAPQAADLRPSPTNGGLVRIENPDQELLDALAEVRGTSIVPVSNNQNPTAISVPEALYPVHEPQYGQPTEKNLLLQFSERDNVASLNVSVHGPAEWVNPMRDGMFSSQPLSQQPVQQPRQIRQLGSPVRRAEPIALQPAGHVGVERSSAPKLNTTVLKEGLETLSRYRPNGWVVRTAGRLAVYPAVLCLAFGSTVAALEPGPDFPKRAIANSFTPAKWMLKQVGDIVL